jgi:hypothetical protein
MWRNRFLTDFFIFTVHLVNNFLMKNMARNLRYILILLFTFGSINVFAQNPGSIEGTVLDEAGEPVIGAVVKVTSGGIARGGTTTDIDGKYFIKPLNPGSNYELIATYTGYSAQRVRNVSVSSDRTTTVNINFSTASIKEVIVTYQPPLIEDGPVRNVLKGKDIEKMPTISLTTATAASSPGLRTDGRSNGIQAAGARSGNTVTIIDGVMVNGAVPNLPQGVVDELEVFLGGLSAKYGDATGAVVSITTRGPSPIYSGGLQLEHSVEGFNHNMASFNLSGPLLSKKLKNGEKKPILGFLFTGEAYYDKNRQPSFYKNYVVKDEVRERLEQKPLVLVPNAGGLPVYYYGTEFVTKSDLEEVKAMPNAAIFEGRALAKLDYQLSDNMNLTFGGNFNYTKGSALAGGGSYNRILFTPESIPVTENFSGRAYLRFTQRFSRNVNDTGRQSRISNAYYSLQADYQKDYSNTEDPNHGRNIFNYGYLGKFYQNTEARYFYDVDTITGRRMWQLLSYDAPTSFTFDRAEVNPVLANYTTQFYELGRTAPTIVELRGQRGLANGDFPGGAYGLYPNIGSTLTGYGYGNTDQIAASANASFDLTLGKGKNKSRHAIEFGLYYRQRIARNYSLSANVGGSNSIWEIMRSNVNDHITLDTGAYYKVNGQVYTKQQVLDGVVIPGIFDTLFYNRRANAEAQTTFDKNLRAKLGLPVNGTDIINVDALDPSTFSLDMLTADDLVRGLGSNASLVSYYGYDYLGNRLQGQVNFNDYFTEKDANGNFTRNIGAYRPNYIAGYILDRFKFKEINFNVGVRVDRYDLNTKVLKDPYSLYETYKVSDRDRAEFEARGTIPGNMGDDYVVYVDNNASSNPAIVGYRNGDDWYNAAGQFIQDPTALRNVSGRDPQPYLTEPGKVDINEDGYDPNKSFTDYKPQTNVSPRIAFQFPINEQSQFYAHYDIIVQGPGGYATPEDYYYLANRTSTTIQNPNLIPEKTFDYEFGFTQTLSKFSAVSIAGTYKERKDQVQIRPYLYAWPQTYYSFGNRDYSTTKGFYLKYDLRRVENLRMMVNYTLQFVEGTGSNASSSANGLLQTFIAAQLPNLRTVFPLDQDNRHIITANIDYRFDEGEGPKIKGTSFLQNAGVNLLFNARSGEPYTRYAQPLRVANTIKGEINGSRLPWHYMLDVRVDKDFALNFRKPKTAEGEENVRARRPLYLNVYCYITNVLNVRDVISVNGFTGRPDDDGYLVSPQGQLDLKVQTNYQSYYDLYSVALRNPYNINLPRRINFGLNLNF